MGEGIHSMHGSMAKHRGTLRATCAGALSNVNGKISLAAAHVGGGIKTINGGDTPPN
jgi:hypothetical protein